MEFLYPLKYYLEQLDKEEFKRYMLAFVAIIIVAIASIFFMYYRSIRTAQTRIAYINKQRIEARQVLERYDRVKKQQAEVNSILSKQKDFKIAQYFGQLLNRLNIEQNKTQEETVPEDVLDGYTEWTLYATLSNLNTKKLSDLLYAIEQEERIYTKELEIERSTQGKAINVKLTIATLEPKTEIEST
jgi:Tfp pilus assembly protein PilN